MRDEDADYAAMARWLTDERVLMYWDGRDNPSPLERVVEEYRPEVLGEGPEAPCIVEFEGRPIGFVRYYPVEPVAEEFGLREEDGAENAYALDLFIGEPERWGQGLGTRTVNAMVRYCFEKLGAPRVFIDPQAWNERAVHVYEKAGFRKLRLMPEHELHEGEHRDCWLMVAERA